MSVAGKSEGSSPDYGYPLSEEESAIAALFNEHVQAIEAQRVHLYPKIPSGKLDNAKTSFASAATREAILGLFDTSVFGSGKAGLVVTVREIYWRKTGAPKAERRTYQQVGGVTADTSALSRGLRLQDGSLIGLAGIQINVVEHLRDFLNSTRHVLVKCWYLGTGGTQQGPHDLRTVRDMIARREIDLSTCLAWKQGMTAWLPVMQVPELAGDQQVPPPLPATSAPPMPSSPPPSVAPAPAGPPKPPSGPAAARLPFQPDLERQKRRWEVLRAQAKQAADPRVREQLERILRERLLDKAEAYFAESAINPAMVDQFADSISDLTATLDELESRIGRKPDDQPFKAEDQSFNAEDQSFLEGLQRLYGKRESGPE